MAENYQDARMGTVARSLKSALGPFQQARVKPVMVFGSEQRLGSVFKQACEARGWRVCEPTYLANDQVTLEGLKEIIHEHSPWAIINAMGASTVNNPIGLNDEFPVMAEETLRLLGWICARSDMNLMNLSTVTVFNGLVKGGYDTADARSPEGQHGERHARNEDVLRQVYPEALTIRTGPLFGNDDPNDSVVILLRALSGNQSVAAQSSTRFSATSINVFANAALDLLGGNASGTWHLANQGSVSLFQIAEIAAREMRMEDPALIMASMSDSDVPRSFRLICDDYPLPRIADEVAKLVRAIAAEQPASSPNRDQIVPPGDFAPPPAGGLTL